LQTLKRINTKYKEGLNGLDLLNIALKARPTNVKLKKFKYEFLHNEDNSVSKEVDEAKEVKEVKEVEDVEDVKEVKTASDVGKVEKIDKDFDLRSKIKKIFAADQGTLKIVIKNIDKDISDRNLIELCSNRRPKNVKLKTLINEYNDFIEEKDDAREFLNDDSIKIYDEDDEKLEDISYVLNDKNLTLFLKGEMKVINDEHPNFKKIVKLLERKVLLL